MNWLVNILQKEARYRRFNPGEVVRFLNAPRKGQGSTVLMPNFGRGKITDYDRASNRYRIQADGEQAEEHNIHPRNVMHDSFRSAPAPEQSLAPKPMEVPQGEAVL